MTDVKYGDILGPGKKGEEARVRRGFWRTFARAARYVPFAEEVVAGYFCAMDHATPPRVRATLLGALAYFVLPFDTIPDFLAGFGFTDDTAVLLAALGMVRSHIRPAHREAARRAMVENPADGGPGSGKKGSAGGKSGRQR